MATDIETVMTALSQMAAYRQAQTTPEALRLFARRLLSEGCQVSDVVLACRHFERTPRGEGETAFPELGRLLARVEVEASARRARANLRALPSGDEPTYRCWQCQDDPAGWLELRCPDTPCERTTEHPPHGYTVRCPHWLRANEEVLRKSAQDAISSGRRPSLAAVALQELDTGAYRYQRSITTRGRLAVPGSQTA